MSPVRTNGDWPTRASAAVQGDRPTTMAPQPIESRGQDAFGSLAIRMPVHGLRKGRGLSRHRSTSRNHVTCSPGNYCAAWPYRRGGAGCRGM